MRFELGILSAAGDDMNMLVSPYYFEGGGTVIDWC
jgi:hypothetical protein